MKERVQKFGRFLSGMVMPNIGAFIAWGLIAALFIEAGWFPNATIAKMVSPMLQYLLPILIAYTGGRAVGGQKGAVAGALATLGAIASTDSTMFIGAMICGPLGGWAIKKFDEKMEGHIPAGFEMVINNFSVGILGGLLAILAIFVIGPLCVVLTDVLGAGVGWLVDHSLLPLTAILVEPAKVLFLNNAINHGVFTPIATEQVEAMRAAGDVGKSILYMIESNPGPGLGLLLAYCVAGKGESRSSAGAATIIEFVGGIHEIYFPYVLMNPIVIAGPMVGNMAGIFVLNLLGGGLTGPASPGSVLSEMILTPKGAYFANIAGIAVAAAVSFAISTFLLKAFGKDASLEEAQAAVAASKAKSKGQPVPGASAGGSTGATVNAKDVKKIVFACDAGMGSSAMGATMVRNKLKSAGVTGIEVVHAPVSEIPQDCQIVVTHHELAHRAVASNPNARVIPIKNFMGAPEYDVLVQEMVEGRGVGGAKPAADTKAAVPAAPANILLEKKNIITGCKSVPSDEAITRCGRMLVESGYVEQAYADAMIERDREFSVAIGCHVAIPHGTVAVKDKINRTGIVVMTYPDGIKWGDEGETVRLVIGIAALGEEHIDVLERISQVCGSDEETDALVASADVETIYRKFNGLE
ncbi:MAG: PTS mannitol transporter subunit IICBA [Oscillospiraceae bacterium]|nr:PTS mannitol transporter subunit IICBA [Oscillospiraceae bacterium]